MASRLVSIKWLLAVVICYGFFSYTNASAIHYSGNLNGESENTFRPKSPCEENKAATNDSGTEQQPSCQGCAERKANLDSEDLRDIRFQVIKEQILQKLQMTNPPCLKLPKPNILPLLLATESTKNETEFGQNGEKLRQKTDSVVTFPSNNGYLCKAEVHNPCASLKFQLTEDIESDSVTSAELWLYPKNANSILKLSENFDPSLPNKGLHFVKEKTNNHWMKFDFGKSIKWSNTNGLLFFNVEIECDGDCDALEGMPVELDGDKAPFLITYIRAPKPTTRNRRSVDCQEGSTTCCRESFTMSFSDIEWDHWILYPDAYKANFCKGKCLTDISITRYHHSTVIHSYIQSNTDDAADIGLTMCCTPSQMSSIDIIYRDDNGNIFRKNLENMVVETCDCA